NWYHKAGKLLDRYKRRGDDKSCRELAEAYMQLGLALEREYQFEEAATVYRHAAQHFEKLPGFTGLDEAAKAYERIVLELGILASQRALKGPPSPPPPKQTES